MARRRRTHRQVDRGHRRRATIVRLRWARPRGRRRRSSDLRPSVVSSHLVGVGLGRRVQHHSQVSEGRSRHRSDRRRRHDRLLHGDGPGPTERRHRDHEALPVALGELRSDELPFVERTRREHCTFAREDIADRRALTHDRGDSELAGRVGDDRRDRHGRAGEQRSGVSLVQQGVLGVSGRADAREDPQRCLRARRWWC